MSNNISIRNIDPQEIVINGQGLVGGITNVYVNGVDVTIGSKAYVVVPTKTSELTNDSGFITNADETDPTVPYYVKEITMADINAWNDKQDLLVSGTSIKTINGESVLGSGNISVNPGYTAGIGIDITDNEISNTITSYNDLTDLPTIPTNTSQLVNDSGYITNTVDDLTNYMNNDFLNKLLPKSEDSGSSLYLKDTADLPLRLDLNPSEITQHTTTGKNLSDLFSMSTTNGGYINKSCGIIGKLKAGTTYTVSFDCKSDIGYAANLTFRSYYPDATSNNYETVGTIPFDTGNRISLTLDAPVNNGEVTISANFSSLGQDTTDILTFIQLEEGSTATSYEEYTGGYASPNPDYPQDLHTINAENVITVLGKNLFNPTETWSNWYGTSCTITDQVITWDGLSTTGTSRKICDINIPAGTYTMSLTTVSGSHSTGKHIWVDYMKGATKIAGTNFTADGSKTTTLSDSIDNIKLGFDSADTLDNYTFKMQLERGSTGTSYAPFETENYPIDLSYVYNADTGSTEDLDLCKITTDNGEYETFFFKNYKDSKYYNSSAPESTIYYNMGVYKYICDPDDDWNFLEDSPRGYIAYVNVDNMWAGSTPNFNLYSNYFLDTSKKDPNSFTCAAARNNTIYINLDYNLSISTLEDWKDFITNNEVIFYIARQGRTIDQQRVSTIEKYTDLASQYHDIMDNAMCSDGATNVIQTNNDLPFDLKGSSYKKIS